MTNSKSLVCVVSVVAVLTATACTDEATNEKSEATNKISREEQWVSQLASMESCEGLNQYYNLFYLGNIYPKPPIPIKYGRERYQKWFVVDSRDTLSVIRPDKPLIDPDFTPLRVDANAPPTVLMLPRITGMTALRMVVRPGEHISYKRPDGTDRPLLTWDDSCRVYLGYNDVIAPVSTASIRQSPRFVAVDITPRRGKALTDKGLSFRALANVHNPEDSKVSVSVDLGPFSSRKFTPSSLFQITPMAERVKNGALPAITCD